LILNLNNVIKKKDVVRSNLKKRMNIRWKKKTIEILNKGKGINTNDNIYIYIYVWINKWKNNKIKNK